MPRRSSRAATAPVTTSAATDVRQVTWIASRTSGLVDLDAGINDWGGVSPLTIDWVNPEAPWPHLDRLRAATEGAGFELQQRLPVYPEFLTDHWVDPALLPKLVNSADQRG